MPTLHYPTDAEIEEKWEPYIYALGEVANSWNHLQEELGHLFVVVGGMDNSVGFAIWHSTPNDRAQREMLRSLSKTLDHDFADQHQSAETDIKWLLNRVDALATKRNDAIHAPCSLALGNGDFELVSLNFFGHPRARNLSGKDIIKEFSWYQKQADTLAAYARRLYTVWGSRQGTWPERPAMPSLEQNR